jgi:hypothetical protein
VRRCHALLVQEVWAEHVELTETEVEPLPLLLLLYAAALHLPPLLLQLLAHQGAMHLAAQT